MSYINVEGYLCEIKKYNPPITKRYHECLKIIEDEGIKQKNINNAIKYILNYDDVPKSERESISQFQAYPDYKIIVIKCTHNHCLFNERINIARNIGWYPYITGVNLKRSEISDYVNQNIKKRKIILEKQMTGSIKFASISEHSNYPSFLLQIGECNILLDAGIRVDDYSKINPKDIDIIFISHAHFDHTSALLQLYLQGCKAVIISTLTTIDFLLLILGVKNGNILLEYFHPISYNEAIKINREYEITAINAGHIPGSAMALISTHNFRILYTGDYCMRDHFPVKGASDTINVLGVIDVLIVDCSFADSKFLGDVDYYYNLGIECEHSLFHGKHVLISADPMITTLNLFLSLFEYFSNPKRRVTKPSIYIEKKAIEYMKVVRTRLEDLPRDFQSRIQRERDPFSSVMRKNMSNINDRKEALKTPSIIMSGPNNNLIKYPIGYFIEHIIKDKDNLLVLTGNGGRFLSEKIVKNRNLRINQKTVYINSKIFDKIIAFHCDYPQLDRTMYRLKPKIFIPFHARPSSLTKAFDLANRHNSKFIVIKSGTEVVLRTESHSI